MMLCLDTFPSYSVETNLIQSIRNQRKDKGNLGSKKELIPTLVIKFGQT